MKFSSVVEETIHSIPLSAFAPEGLMNHTNLFWSADGTHLIVEARCEGGTVLQVIRIVSGERVYQYECGDAGALLNRYENKIIYDLYDPEKKEQSIQIMDLSEMAMDEKSSSPDEKTE